MRWILLKYNSTGNTRGEKNSYTFFRQELVNCTYSKIMLHLYSFFPSCDTKKGTHAKVIAWHALYHRLIIKGRRPLSSCQKDAEYLGGLAPRTLQPASN